MSALGFFIYYAYSRIAFYLQFTMNVSVEVNFLSRMPFPAVTFCNQNSFKYSHQLHSIHVSHVTFVLYTVKYHGNVFLLLEELMQILGHTKLPCCYL